MKECHECSALGRRGRYQAHLEGDETTLLDIQHSGLLYPGLMKERVNASALGRRGR
jgi:hypothetical protein